MWGRHRKSCRAPIASGHDGHCAGEIDVVHVSKLGEEFLDRWAVPAPGGDPLAVRLRLIAEWLDVIRREPRLPVEHLPAGWPAVRAQKVFRELESACRAGAQQVADGLLETLPLSSSG